MATFHGSACACDFSAASLLLKEPLTGPNDYFALPSEVDGPKTAAGGGSTFTYDAIDCLVAIEGPSLLGARDEYLYDCQ